MIKLDRIGNRIILLAVIFCFLKEFATTEVPSAQKISKTSSDGERAEDSGSDKPETSTDGDFGKEFSAEDSMTSESSGNETTKNFDRIKDILHPLLSLPFLPFHILNLRGNAQQANSSGGEREIAGSQSPRKPKPFMFIDFSFNIEEIPARNQTSRENSSGLDDDSFEVETIRPGENFAGKESKERMDVLDDDWSFFGDSPLPPRDFDEFLPKPDWLFFDLPFRERQSKKQSRRKRDKPKPTANGETGKLKDIFDSVISRTEMERAMPIWKFMRGVDKTEEKGDDRLTSSGSYALQDPDTTWNEIIPTKLNPIDWVRPKSPILLGKAVKIREFHFRDDYPKNKLKKKRKKKRGNISSSGENEKLEFREQRSPRMEDNKRLRTVRGTQDAKIMDLLAQWDRRAMEEQAEGVTPKTKTFEMYNERVPDDFRAAMPKDEKFKYVGQIPGKREISKHGAGFEVVKPQQSPPRKKRQGSDEGGNWENVTASRDEVRRNITHVLGQFFSMIRKLGESKNFYKNGESQDMGEIIWPELGQVHGSRSYIKDTSKRRRDGRQTEAEEKYKSAPVSDLNFLFMTVTLPTTLAFTLLLLICFFNLRSKSWLCHKVFQNRKVYIVEEDVEKAKSFGKVTQVPNEDEKDVEDKGAQVKDESQQKTKKTRKKERAA